MLGLLLKHLLGASTEKGINKWESLRDVARWSGLKDEHKHKKKEGLAVLLLKSMNERMIDFQNVNSRVCLVKVRMEKIKWLCQ